eukprot:33183-Eustigmatos_ZCMA.PRE.1
MSVPVMQAGKIAGSDLRKNDSKRFWGLLFTILWIIQLLYPFCLAERDNVRSWMAANNPEFDPAHVHHEQVRHYIVEIYKAVEAKVKASLAAALLRRLPAF